MRKALLLASAIVSLCWVQTTSFALAQSAPQNITQRGYFEFHSNFWVNLHQTLFADAMNSSHANFPQKQGTAQSAKWNVALDVYRKDFAEKSLLFDPQLIRINDWLAKQPDDGNSLDSSGLPPDVATALTSAAEVYRPIWKQADLENHLWIQKIEPQVIALAPTVVPRLEEKLGMPWPEHAVRMDISNDVHEIGQAYTTDHPPHTTISSRSPQNQDLAGVEIVFHEAAHTMTGNIERALAHECVAQKKNCGDLWHALLFYTVGDAVKLSLPENQRSTFVPYAYHFGLYNHATWKTYRAALEKDWQPYLDGKITCDSAIHGLVSDL